MNPPPGVAIVLASLLALGACQSSEISVAGEPGGQPGGSGGTGGAGGAAPGTGYGGAPGVGCADALIALDRSCSMNNTPKGFTKSKYAVAQEIIGALTAQYDAKMAFGLNAFPPLPSEGKKCDAGKVYAGIGLGSSGAIASAITAIDPSVPGNQNCGTPTAANLETLAGYAPLKAPGKKHNIILLTDGMPACQQETVPRSVAAIDRLRLLGVRTFVVGFLAGANQKALDMMAEAGGAPQPPPAATKYFNAADPEQLDFGLRKILSSICGDIPTPTCPPTAPTCGAGTACPAGTTCASGCCFPIIQ